MVQADLIPNEIVNHILTQKASTLECLNPQVIIIATLIILRLIDNKKQLKNFTVRIMFESTFNYAHLLLHPLFLLSKMDFILCLYVFNPCCYILSIITHSPHQWFIGVYLFFKTTTFKVNFETSRQVILYFFLLTFFQPSLLWQLKWGLICRGGEWDEVNLGCKL